MPCGFERLDMWGLAVLWLTYSHPTSKVDSFNP